VATAETRSTKHIGFWSRVGIAGAAALVATTAIYLIANAIMTDPIQAIRVERSARLHR